MNIDHVKQVRDDIKREPTTKFDMGDFGRFDASCGTVMCIAGFATLRAGCTTVVDAGEDVEYVDATGKPVDPETAGAEYLDLSEAAMRHMFYGHWSRKDLEYLTKADALRYLDKVIETGSPMVSI